MLKPFETWLDERTGWLGAIRSAAGEMLAGGARWRYVTGSALASVFVIQAVTGATLMMTYSPSSSTAWGSVYYIGHVMWMGWFVRGLHHFGAQTVMILMVLHLLQVLVAGSYRRPREVNWWLGLVLLVLTVGFGHTGYQLPWDQKGYWATKVVTNIMGGAPVIGPYLKTILVGGSEFGSETVTRFYALHVAFLPALMFACLAAHVVLRRRHGLTPPARVEPGRDEPYWPGQVFKNMLFLGVVVGIMAGLVVYEGGAPLDAPADPSSADYPARPEWFFLSLFQLLKYFPGRLEWVGTIVIPSTVMGLLILLPLFDRILPGKLVHFAACTCAFALLGGASYLTVEALRADAADPAFHAARRDAEMAQRRAIQLASSPEVGVPPEGAGFLLRLDPFTQGQAALRKKCLGCHVLEGTGADGQSASDLAAFGSRAWVRGLLENPRSATYFGKVPACDGMAEWKKSSKLSAAELDAVADFVASFATIPADLTTDEWLNTPGVADHPGGKPFQKECGQCHLIDGFTEGGLRDAPGLFGWGSPRWISRLIRKPSAPDLYGYYEREGRMPAFVPAQLTDNDLNMIVRFLKNDFLPPLVGETLGSTASQGR